MSDINLLIATGDGQEDRLLERLNALAEDEGVTLRCVGAPRCWDDLRGLVPAEEECIILLSRLLPESSGGVPPVPERVAQLLNGLCRSLPTKARVVLLVGPRDDAGQIAVDAAIASGVYDIVLARETGKIATTEIVKSILHPATYRDVADLQRSIPVALPEEASQDSGEKKRLHLPKVRVPNIRLDSRHGDHAHHPPAGKLIVVAGFSGGVGRTTVTAHLVTGLALGGHRVAAIDANFGAPTLHDHVGLKGWAPGRWASLGRGEAPAVALVDATPGMAVSFRLLPGPSREERHQVLPPEGFVRTFEAIRAEHDITAIDLSPDPDCPYALAAATRADAIIYVVTPAPDAIKRLAALLAAPPWSGDHARGYLVVNHEAPNDGMGANTVARKLGIPGGVVAAAIPHAPTAYWGAVTSGTPLVFTGGIEAEPWKKLCTYVVADLITLAEVSRTS